VIAGVVDAGCAHCCPRSRGTRTESACVAVGIARCPGAHLAEQARSPVRVEERDRLIRALDEQETLRRPSGAGASSCAGRLWLRHRSSPWAW
jgi:hypothetical protein